MVDIGIDIGSVSVKVAVVGDKSDRELLEEIASKSLNFFSLENGDSSPLLNGKSILVSNYTRIKGMPVQATYKLLEELYSYVSEDNIRSMRVTGTGGHLIGQILDVPYENDFRAVAHGVGILHPDVQTIFEMGGENSKYLSIEVDENDCIVGIQDYDKNGECAAGTGSFMDQQATRLECEIEDVGHIVMGAGKAANIAGRCSVFAKSDMIHAQQKGVQTPEILKGLCDAVVRNFKGSIVKSKKIAPKVVFIGGVAANEGVVQAMRSLFELNDEDFFVSGYYAWMSAIGAALLSEKADEKKKPENIAILETHSESKKQDFPTLGALSMGKVTLLRDRVKPYSFHNENGPVDAYLGIDVGSVSTNIVAIDDDGKVIMEIYVPTAGEPIEVVTKNLKVMGDKIGDRITVKGVGTTGSGRELAGVLMGADTINDEITAHKTGAAHIADMFGVKRPDTIFEIGGQDAKYISIQDDVVVDFTMNEACAAGTGSFLEEQAEKLGLNIKDEFAELALSSQHPIRLGERCTVFMEKDLNPYLQRGAGVEELVAGLANSIATNYLNRVVRGRHIGNSIFFQGGTAYNDSVVAAFATVLDQEIIVPPHNGVIGAIGAALLAKEKMSSLTNKETTFNGYDLDKVDYSIRHFVCKACSNRCDMQEVKVKDERTYWGDKCSDRYRKRSKTEKEPIIPDLVAFREDFFSGYYEEKERGDKIRVGIPRAMYTYDRLPFWNAFLSELGFDVVVSDKSSKKVIDYGTDGVVAEPCFPIKLEHGHVGDLLDRDVDYIFIPNMLDAETEFMDVNSHMCPWGQTMTFIVGHSPIMEGHTDKLLQPTVHFREGQEAVTHELQDFARKFKMGKNQVADAVSKAYEVQAEFNGKLLEAGQQAIKALKEADELGIVIVGRSYNMYDSGVNLGIPQKLRAYYGVNVIPMDFLPLKGVDISDVNKNMYWDYGKKILQAAKVVAQHPNLHIIYITNFKCGPDSYIKHFVRQASDGKPFLTLQFDGHSNDAGFMTRCEAYLDSKGFLRWWKRQETAALV